MNPFQLAARNMNFLSTTYTFLLDVLKLVYGDPKTRVPKTIIGAGLAAVTAPWWQPLLFGALSHRIEIDEFQLEKAEMLSFWGGWVLLAIGIGLYCLVDRKSRSAVEQATSDKSHIDELRMNGSRIEVIALLLTRVPEQAVLLGKSPYHNMWMPPQEGVRISESFDEALRRCLTVECGISAASDPSEFDRLFHLRSIRFIGTIKLSKARQGERLVAPDAVGSSLESVTLTQKSYWLATLIVSSQSELSPVPDGRELLDLKWYSIAEAKHVIESTNHEEKGELLIQALDDCVQDLDGI